MNEPARREDRAVVVEWAPFRLVEGVGERELLAASDTLQRDFLAHQPGFVRRELLRGANGAWADLIHWSDEATANAALAAAGQSAVCQEYFKLILMPDGADPAAGVLHLTRVRTYEA
jgi:hypothetical protein